MNNETHPMDRRENLRCDLRLKCSLRIDDDYYNGITGDISLGGASIQEITPELPKGCKNAIGRLTLKLPNRSLALQCQLKHVGQTTAGTTFIEPDENVIAQIRTHILNRLFNIKT